MNVGQQVMCVDDFFAPEIARLYEQLPTEGVVYTIRAIHEGNSLDDGAPKKCTVILLVGVTNQSPSLPGGKERGFNSKRFREMEEMKKGVMQKRLNVQDLDCVGVNDGDVRIYEPAHN